MCSASLVQSVCHPKAKKQKRNLDQSSAKTPTLSPGSTAVWFKVKLVNVLQRVLEMDWTACRTGCTDSKGKWVIIIQRGDLMVCRSYEVVRSSRSPWFLKYAVLTKITTLYLDKITHGIQTYLACNCCAAESTNLNAFFQGESWELPWLNKTAWVHLWSKSNLHMSNNT